MPDDSYIIAEFPTVIASISDIKGISTRHALANINLINQLAQKTDVYYFYDGYCTRQKISYSKNSASRCKDMLRQFNTKPVASFENKYHLYKLQPAIS